MKYKEFRFETCHTSPGNNSTSCVKNKVPGHNGSAVCDVRVTSFSADFDQQKGFTGITVTGEVLKLRSFDLLWNDVELVGLQNWFLGFSKFWKFREKKSKKCPFFLSKKIIKIEILNHPYNMFEGNVSWIIKHVKNRHFSPYFGTLSWFS